MKLPKSETGFSHLLIPLIIVVLGAAGFAAWKVYETNKTTEQPPSNFTVKTQAADQAESKPDIPEGFVEYKNEELSFSFFYPKEQAPVTDITNEEGQKRANEFRRGSKEKLTLELKDVTISLNAAESYIYHAGVQAPMYCPYDVSKNKFSFDPSNQYGIAKNCELVTSSFSNVPFFEIAKGDEVVISNSYLTPVLSKKYMLFVTTGYVEYNSGNQTKEDSQESITANKQIINTFMDRFVPANKDLFK
jgi:cytoskeletal protein RodZ